MKNHFKKHKSVLPAFVVIVCLTFAENSAYAQVKVGDNPQTINGGSALEVESTSKGVLLPRVNLNITTVWGLDGTPTRGMLVYNMNGNIFGTPDHPIINQGSGVYYWDGNGWVGTKAFQPDNVVGDFDWLNTTNNSQPNNPDDIKGLIYHGNATNKVTVGYGGIDLYSKSPIDNGFIDFKNHDQKDWDARISLHKTVGTHGAFMFSVNNGVGPGDSSPELPFASAAITILNSNAFVGIDQTNPQYKLDVRGDINATGDIKIGGMSITSDARLKEDIKPIEKASDLVSKLNPVSYKKKVTIADKDFNRSEMGFIAQEVQKILPQLVREGKDADKTLALDYNSLIPVLTRAIQEQQILIEKLSGERTEHKAMLRAQSAKLDAQSDEISEIKKMLNMSQKDGKSGFSK